MSYFFDKKRVPTDWRIVRADAASDYVRISIRAKDLDGKVFFHYSIPSIQEIGDGFLQNGSELDSDKTLLVGGEILISKLNPEKGTVMLTKKQDYPIICSTELVPIMTKDILRSKFAFYIYSSDAVREHLSSMAISATKSHKRVEPSEIYKMFLPLPDLKIQDKIVDFLDYELQNINGLINEKQKQLEILSEKHQSLITHAVTKGINPKANLKNSGIDWLEEIPNNWTTIRLKYLGDIFYGLSQPPKYIPEGTALIRATNVYRGAIKHDGLVFIDETELETEKKIKLNVGDIIVVRSGAYTGDSAIVTEEWENAIAGFDMIIRPNNNVIPKFLATILLSSYVLDNQLLPLRIRAAQPHLNSEEIGSVKVFLPSLDEQQKILKFLSIEIDKIGMLADATKTSIDLLKERRSALITAAVTGQLQIP
ncbi:hypothetical protein ECE50_019130 [Chitinophaga sp. Mgbs1]|uniref:Type I restriction modification DNA specificity domain-containing protein n=1 Tax=Chitinophaga solisilvae TaxID=1233460 RepID=A0A3S1DJX9_9BACT|nr:hypothetical protein [Chitinophaga solisilvae]